MAHFSSFITAGTFVLLAITFFINSKTAKLQDHRKMQRFCFVTSIVMIVFAALTLALAILYLFAQKG